MTGGSGPELKDQKHFRGGASRWAGPWGHWGRPRVEAQVRRASCRSAQWMAPATQTDKAPSVSGSLPGPAGTCSWAGTTEAGPRMSPKPHTGTDLRSWRPPLWRRVSRGQGSLPRPLAPKGHTSLPRLYSPCLNSATLSGGEEVQVPPLVLPRVCPPLGSHPHSTPGSLWCPGS